MWQVRTMAVEGEKENVDEGEKEDEEKGELVLKTSPANFRFPPKPTLEKYSGAGGGGGGRSPLSQTNGEKEPTIEQMIKKVGRGQR